MTSRLVLALLLASSVCTRASLAAPGDPFGGDDAGCFPQNKTAKKCQDTVAKAASKALVCILKCHVKRADGKLVDDAAEDACESSGPKSCKGKFDAATGPTSKINALCPPCLTVAARAGVYTAIESQLDGGTNAAVYCSSVGGAFGGDDAGFVPVAKSNDQKCEDKVAKALSKASACLLTCGFKLAGGKFADDAAEDVCESGLPKSCKVKYDAATGPTSKIDALCPACLDATARGAQFASAETQFDALSGVFYCCEPPPTTTTVTTTTVTTTTSSTSTTQPPGVVLQGVLNPTTGKFNYNLVIGIPGSDSACNTIFPGSHTCTFADLQSAQGAGDLVGRKDLHGTLVSSFWAIDSSHPDTTQCHNPAAWAYETAHTGHFAEVSALNNGAGTLGPVTAGLCLNQSWVGCCL